MTKIVFIRHGQTEWNLSGKYQGQTNIPLSEEGIAQARMLAERFPLEHLDAVYASDLDRAMMTACCIAGKFHLRVQPEAAFRELNFGEWEGLTYEQVIARWPDAAKNFLPHPERLEIPGGETVRELQIRVMGRVREIIEEHGGKSSPLWPMAPSSGQFSVTHSPCPFTASGASVSSTRR